MTGTEMNSGNALALPEGFILYGRYRLGKVLGAGGFGITYKAFDELNKSWCAIKEYVPLGICMRLEDRTGLVATNSEMEGFYSHGKERFMEEAGVLLEVADIPNIVRITDYFEENGTAYYVMEYLEGSTVWQLQKIMPDKKIPFQDALKILNKVGKALDKVHTRHYLLHRDISPDNIFITVDEKIKLIDFGSAKHVCGQGNQNFSVVLKPHYAPPEQYQKDGVQGSYTDVYALASTFYCMICGEMLPDSMERLVGENYISAYKRVPEMTRQMSAVLDKALQTDYRKRYQSVGQFLSELTSAGTEKEELARAYPVKRSVVMWKENGVVKKSWVLPGDAMFKIGRAEEPGSIVVKGHPEVSKLHCYVQYDTTSGMFLVKDVSMNGTWIGKKRLKRDCVYAVAPGSVLRLAQVCELELGEVHGK